MQDSNDESQFDKSQLESPAYRQRLMRKINCLIAVLEVACSKVRRSLDAPNADTHRLEKIQANLTQTLDVCRRAKGALERREQLPVDLPGHLAEISNIENLNATQQPRGERVEFVDSQEAERFESMGPISEDELSGVDFDELSRRLQEG